MLARPTRRAIATKGHAPKAAPNSNANTQRIHQRVKQWASKIADKDSGKVARFCCELYGVKGLIERNQKRCSASGADSEQWFNTWVDKTTEAVKEAAWYQHQKQQSIEWLKAIYGDIEGKAHQSIDHLGPLIRLNHNRKFYEKGWGNKKVISYMYEMIDKPQNFMKENMPASLQIKWVREEFRPDCMIADGKFEAPLSRLLPAESQTAHFRIIVPRQAVIVTEGAPVFTSDALQSTLRNRPRMCVLLGGTGDHGFGLRQHYFAKRLLKYNIGSVILENPFYGSRKPKEQSGSCLGQVSDLMLLGSSIILEANALANWLELEGRYGGVGFAGMSMGGINACLAAAVGQRTLALAPLIAPYSAGPVFASGVISRVCDWDTLKAQLPDYVSPQDSNLTAPQFMLKLLDDLTDLRRYPRPRSPEFVVQVRAKHDQYVPDGYDLRDYWPGSEVRYISAGHISSVALNFLPQFAEFNTAIIDSFAKLEKHRKQADAVGTESRI